MKIYATPCARGPEAWTHQFDRLKLLYESSNPRLHQWVEDPRSADLIFLTNAEQAVGPVLEEQPLPRRFPEKCFLLSEQDGPPFLLAGIYASAPRTTFGRGRFRTGSYALHHPDFKNPFIEAYDYPTERNRRRPDLLASFAGRDCHPVRHRLLHMNFAAGDVWLEDTSAYDAFVHHNDTKTGRQRYYFDLCLRSKFILCPRGASPNSIRLFEALNLGIAPVVISDAWVPCEGPAWEQFAIFVAEANLGDLPHILAEAEATYQVRGERAWEAYRRFFSPESYFNYLVAAAGSARAARIVPERWFVATWPIQRLWRRARARTRRVGRSR